MANGDLVFEVPQDPYAGVFVHLERRRLHDDTLNVAMRISSVLDSRPTPGQPGFRARRSRKSSRDCSSRPAEGQASHFVDVCASPSHGGIVISSLPNCGAKSCAEGRRITLDQCVAAGHRCGTLSEVRQKATQHQRPARDRILDSSCYHLGRICLSAHSSKEWRTFCLTYST